MISGPIVADQLAFRLAGDIRHSRTTARLAPLMRGADPNDDDYSLARLKLIAEPRALPGFRLLTTLVHSHTQSPQTVLIEQPFRDRRYLLGGYGIFRINVSSATIRATQAWPNGQIEIVSSLSDTRTRRFAEAGVGEATAHLTDLSADMFGRWRVAPTITLRGGVHRLGSHFLQHIDLSQFIRSVGDFDDRQRSFGAFAEAEIDLTPQLMISAGGRYQQDRQRRVGGLVGRVTLPVDFDIRFSAWLPKFSASYALTPRLKAGVLMQRAYNPGGATIAFNTGELDSFKAERLWDYELFVKGDVARSHLSIAANLFINAVDNAQRGVLVPFVLPSGSTSFLLRYNNVPKASTRGAELDLSWHSSSALMLRGGIGLLRSRVRSARNDDGDVIGREFERSPHFTVSAAFDWNPVKPLRLSAQLRYHSRYFSDDFDTPELRIGRAAIVDVRGSYDWGKVTLFAYVRNAFDSFHLNYRFSPNEATADDPRTVGIGVEARF